MPDVNGGTITVRINGQDTGLAAVLQTLEARMLGATSIANQFITQQEDISVHAKREQAAVLASATAFLRYHESIGQAAVGQAALARALDVSNEPEAKALQSTQAYANALNALQGSINRTDAAVSASAAKQVAANAQITQAQLQANLAAASLTDRVTLLTAARNAQLPGTLAYINLQRQVTLAEQAVSAAEAKQARDAQQLAQAQLQASLAVSTLRDRVTLLQSALRTTTSGTLQYINIQKQLILAKQAVIDEEKRDAAAKLNAKSAGDQLLSGLSKLIGVYFALSTAISKVTDAVEKGNDLEKTDATFKALSKTQEEYIKNLAAAKTQQDKYGGSLKDTEEDLAGFIFTARGAKVPVEALLNLGRKLAILDPVR